MARINIDLPSSYLFSCSIKTRITDLNYGGHVGNDTILSLIHEARMQFLMHFGYTEKDLDGTGLIMGDVAIVFKSELFYGDIVRVHVAVTEISRASFDLTYKLEKEKNGKVIDVAYAKTGLVCYNYEKGKVGSLPDSVKAKWA